MVLEIYRVEASLKEDGYWTMGNPRWCGIIRTRAYDVRRAIKRALAGMGVTFGRTHTRITCDGDRYEVRVMATDEPLYIAVRVAASHALKSN